IQAGTQVEANTPVDIYISIGPKEEPKEEPAENEEIPITISITPQSENEQVEIRIDRIQDGKRQTVYRNVVETTGKELKIKVTGKKGSKFEIYQDGELIKEIQHPGK